MTFSLRPLVMALSVSAACAASGLAHADNVKIAFLDPLSGPFAPLGENTLRSWQFVADIANKEKWAGNNTFEIVGFDNKGSPQETLPACAGMTINRMWTQWRQRIANANKPINLFRTTVALTCRNPP